MKSFRCYRDEKECRLLGMGHFKEKETFIFEHKHLDQEFSLVWI